MERKTNTQKRNVFAGSIVASLHQFNDALVLCSGCNYFRITELAFILRLSLKKKKEEKRATEGWSFFPGYRLHASESELYQACAEEEERMKRQHMEFKVSHNLTIKGYFSCLKYKRKYLLIVWLSLSEAQSTNFQHHRRWTAPPLNCIQSIRGKKRTCRFRNSQFPMPISFFLSFFFESLICKSLTCFVARRSSVCYCSLGIKIHASKVVVKSHTTPTGHQWELQLFLRKNISSLYHELCNNCVIVLRQHIVHKSQHSGIIDIHV